MNPGTETSGITRRSLAETYEAQDLIIQAAQDAKREATKAYREQLDGAGMDKDAIKSEVEGFKKAFRRKMDGQKKGAEAVEHVDAIADEIFLEITSPAPRATRVAIDVPSFVAFTSDGNEYRYDAETGEITEPQEAQAPAQALPEADSLGLASSLPGAEGAVDREPITEPQPAPQAEQTGAAHELLVTPLVESESVEISTPIQPETANDDRSCASVPGGLAKGLQQQATREGEAARPLPPTMQAFGLEVAEAVQ